jgi:hypothetical protein
MNKEQQSPIRSLEILIEASTPEIYKKNAFRILGLSVNACISEITSKIQKIQMLEKYGNKTEIIESPLPIVPPPDSDQIRQALHRLRDPETRIIDEFFWFWPHSIDGEIKDHALDALSRSDIKTAESLWINYEATLTESNVSRHNLAVLSHLLVLDIELNGNSLTKVKISERDKYWKDTFKRWKHLLDHEGFWSRLTARVRQMDDPRLTTGFVKRMRESLPYAILQINASLALKAAEAGDESEAVRQIELMNNSGFGKEIVSRALKHVANPLRTRIKVICKSLSDDTYPDKKSELEGCKKLLVQTKELLSSIDILLKDDNTIKEGAHDEVALAAMGLAISYANATEDWESVVPIFEELRKIVIGESAKNRIEKNYEIFKSNVEFDRVHNTCFFCSENKADKRSFVEVKMHGDVRTYNYGDYSRTTWSHITFEVPRCEKCKALHEGKSGEHKKEYLIEKEKYDIEYQRYNEEREKFLKLNKFHSKRDLLLFFTNLFFAFILILSIYYIPNFRLISLIAAIVGSGLTSFYIFNVFKKKILPIMEERNNQKPIMENQQKRMWERRSIMFSKKSKPYSSYSEFSQVKEQLNKGWTWGESPA